MSNSRKKQLKNKVSVLDKMLTNKMSSLELSRALKSLEVTETRLKQYRKNQLDTLKSARHNKTEVDAQLRKINKQRMNLTRLNPKEPVITEHAILRYVERVLKIDLEECFKAILELPEEQVVKRGNTIITVYTDQNDHINLAENEKI